MPTYSADGIVLRSHALGESDRILHILSPNLGMVRAVAKGVRRPGSRFGGRLEPFGHVSLLLHAGRSLDTVSQVELITPNDAVRGDWAASACASTMAEACDKLAQEGARAPGMFLLLRDALAVLAAGPRRPAAVLDAFLLRLAAIEGFSPVLDACTSCGSTEDLVAFHVGDGGMRCAAHLPADSQRMAAPTHDALVLLAEGSWTDIAEGEAPLPRSAAALVRAYVSHHLATTLRAWESVPR